MFHRAFNIGGLERENVPKEVGSPANRCAAAFSLYQEKNARKIQGSRAATRAGGEQWYKVNPIEYIIQYKRAATSRAMMSIAHDSAQ
jgi:hypothetical protein